MNYLLNSLPASGRLQYASDNLDSLRPIIDEITTLVIRLNPLLMDDIEKFFTIVKEKDNAIINICKKNGTDSGPFLLFDKYRKDMYRRLGGVVLNIVDGIKFEQSRMKNYKDRRSRKRVARAKRKSFFSELIKLNMDFECETKNMFEDFLRNLDKADYKRKVEEGIIEC